MQGRHLRFQELYVPPAGLVPELAAIQLMVKPGGRLRLALRDQVAYSGGLRGVGALGVLLVVVSICAARVAAAPELKLTIGEDDVDVEHRTIHFALATVAASAQLEVFSPEGERLHVETTTFERAAPGARLSVSWPDLGAKGQNFRLELKITDSEGYWVGFQVIRFYLEIPHEEIAFASAKWDISSQEAPKLVEPLRLLKDAVAKYAKLMEVRLYVAGHTDTVGKASDNQALSEKRASSIASYFADKGLTGIPIFVRGFGEGALAVETADNVAQARNRRAQYIISTFEPQIAGPGSWRRVR